MALTFSLKVRHDVELKNTHFTSYGHRNGGVYYLLGHVGPVQCRPDHGPGVHQTVTERMGNVAPETVRTPISCFEVAGLGSLHYDVLNKKTIKWCCFNSANCAYLSKSPGHLSKSAED